MDIPLHMLYCPSGTPYFDLPGAADDAAEFDVTGVPDGWGRTTDPEWSHLEAPGAALPDQGWKIHVSATPESAARVLQVTADYCVAQGLTFKHLRGPEQLFRRNWKYASRSESGKFITVYPPDEDRLADVLHELGDLLDGEPGPYILSDVRWRRGPLYVRYGAFRKIELQRPDGSSVYCIVSPDGELEPDVRRPGFHPPAWATPPAVLTEALEARLAGTLKDFPFTVQRPLHYSNGGGVYQGTDTRDGVTVLLREARPDAGLDLAGRDAVARLVNEKWALERLEDVAVVPRLIEHRRGHEHHYLVRDFVDGIPWGRWVLESHPMVTGSGRPEDREDYARTVTRLFEELEQGVAQMHDRDVVFADLHPNNVLVTGDLRPMVIDLEMVRSTTSEEDQTIGAPGFTAPTGVRGPAIDHHALGSLLLWSLIPVTGPLGRGAEMVEAFLTVAEEWFPGFTGLRERVEGLVRVVADDEVRPFRTMPHPGPWRREERGRRRAALAAGIVTSADTARRDRLYPGDARQFAPGEGGAGLAYGAAGVLWALAECDVSIPREHVEWLSAAAPQVAGDGLFSGAAGVAVALARVGREEQALDLLRPAVDRAQAAPDETLWRGAAGTALAALHLAEELGDGRLRDSAVRVARTLAARARERVASGAPTDRPGLTHGPLGTALLLLRAVESTGDADLLAVASTLLDRELTSHPALRPGGPPPPGAAYGLAQGVAGIVVVAEELLRHRDDERALELRHSAPVLLDRPLHPEAGLLHGRAGLALALQAAGAPADVVDRQLDRLDLHVVRHLEGTAVLGEQGLRVSTDLGTGSAGVLLVEHGVSTGRPALRLLTGTANPTRTLVDAVEARG